MTLYRKYRPQKFIDVVGQDHIRDTLVQAVKEGRLSQAYLFSGPRGTGKTTTARLIAKVANCLELEKNRLEGKPVNGEPCGKCANCQEISEGRSIDIIEIDAASNRGIDEIRQLRDQVRFAPAKSKFKVYIIDEVHMLTREAFNALLKTLEEPPAHAIFILATTEPHKVLPTIISRTQRFDFGRIGLADLVANMQKIAQAEGYEADKSALELIALLAEGGGRDSLSLLEQVASYSSDISMENVRSILGVAETSQVIGLMRAIFNSEAEEGLKIAQALFDSGTNLNQLNASILNVLRKVLNWSVAGQFLVDDTDDNKEKLLSLCQLVSDKHGAKASAVLMLVIKEFIDCNKMIKDTIDPLVAMEVAIIASVEACGPKTTKIEVRSKEANSAPAAAAPKVVTKKIEPKVEPESKSADQLQKAVHRPVENQEESSSQVDIAENAEKPSQGIKLLAGIDEQLWAEIVAELKKDNNSLAALLKDAKPMAVESGRLVLGVRFKFHRDKISEAKNVQLLEGVICSVTKSSCTVKCEIADFNAKQKTAASDEELAAEAEKVFG